jgi:hypothetical protein
LPSAGGGRRFVGAGLLEVSRPGRHDTAKH